MDEKNEVDKQLESYRNEIKKLYNLLSINTMITSTLDPEEIKDTIMKKGMEFMDAEAGAVLLIDEKTEELYFNVPQGEKSEEVKTIRVPKGEGVAGWVAKSGQPLVVSDTSKDPRFYGKVDEKTKFHTRSILCVPLYVKDRIIGVLQALNKRSGGFTDEDLVIFNILAHQVGIAIDNSDIYSRANELMERGNRQLLAISEVGGLINSITNLRRLLVLFIQLALNVVGADVGSVMLLVDSTLTNRVSYGLEETVIHAIRFKDGQEVVNKVMETGEVEVIRDLGKDSRIKHFVSDVIIKSFLCIPLKTYEKTIGVLNIINVDEETLSDDALDLLLTITNLSSTSIENARLYDEVKGLYDKLYQSYAQVKEINLETILRLAVACEAKDEDTGGHVQRIQHYVNALWIELGGDQEEAELMGYYSILHDVGKLHIPDAVLQKPDVLDSGEWDLMKKHTIHGERILGDKEFFVKAREIARWHHESPDGSGYPDGLKGDEIPRPAQVAKVADIFDALTGKRPYKVAWPEEKAIEELNSLKGTKLEEDVVEAFMVLWQEGRIREIGNRLSESIGKNSFDS